MNGHLERRWSRQVVTKTEAEGDAGVVVSARRQAAEAGAEMLARGGTAVDAAVAAAFVEAVVEPTDATAGGCGFMLIHDGVSGNDVSVEFPAVAPLAAEAEMFDLENERTDRIIGVRAVIDRRNSVGPLAATVPGLVAGLCAAHERFGRLPLAAVVEPAIAAADNGFVADAALVLETVNERSGLARHGLDQLLLEDGMPMSAAFTLRAEPGEERLIRQPALARTLELVARNGVEDFYRGEVARTLCEEIQLAGGILTPEDFAAYRPRVRQPLELDYRGSRLLTPAAPCGGWSVLETLGILAHFDLPALEPGSSDALHLLTEALRRAFADRYRYLADPDMVAVPLHGLLSGGYLADVASQINRAHPTTQLPAGEEPWQHYAERALHDPLPWDSGDRAPSVGSPDIGDGVGTTHLSAADASGTVVSCTHTAVTTFGSMFRSCTGVILNSAMVWFDPKPGAANSIAPGKRPLCNMAPLLVIRPNGQVAGIGAPGGRRIVSAVTQVASNLLNYDMSIQEAIGAPRIDASGNALLLSGRVSSEVVEELAHRGHRVRVIREEHEPFSYEFARPVGAVAGAGRQTAGADPFTENAAVGLCRRPGAGRAGEH